VLYFSSQDTKIFKNGQIFRGSYCAVWRFRLNAVAVYENKLFSHDQNVFFGWIVWVADWVLAIAFEPLLGGVIIIWGSELEFVKTRLSKYATIFNNPGYSCKKLLRSFWFWLYHSDESGVAWTFLCRFCTIWFRNVMSVPEMSPFLSPSSISYPNSESNRALMFLNSGLLNFFRVCEPVPNRWTVFLLV